MLIVLLAILFFFGVAGLLAFGWWILVILFWLTVIGGALTFLGSLFDSGGTPNRMMPEEDELSPLNPQYYEEFYPDRFADEDELT